MTDQQVYEEFVQRVRGGHRSSIVSSWLEEVSCDKDLMEDLKFVCRGGQLEMWKPWAHEGCLFQIADAHGMRYTAPEIDLLGIKIKQALEESDRKRK